jgi:hypothetical protein
LSDGKNSDAAAADLAAFVITVLAVAAAHVL